MINQGKRRLDARRHLHVARLSGTGSGGGRSSSTTSMPSPRAAAILP